MAADGGEFGVHLIQVTLRPSDRRYFDLAIRRDVEKRGHIGQTVGAGDGVVIVGVVDGDGKIDAVFVTEVGSLGGAVLRDAKYADTRVPIRLSHALVQRKRILAHWATDLEERQ